MNNRMPVDVNPLNLSETRYVVTNDGVLGIPNSIKNYYRMVYRARYDAGITTQIGSTIPICIKEKVLGVCPYLESEGDSNVYYYSGRCAREPLYPCKEDSSRWTPTYTEVAPCDGNENGCTYIIEGEYNGECPFDVNGNNCPNGFFSGEEPEP